MTLTSQGAIASSVVTPTIRKASRAVRYWIIAGVGAVLAAILSILITGIAGSATTPLSPTDASPVGSKAIAEVLRAQGVTVTAADSVRGVRAAAGSATQTTLFIVDDKGYLGVSDLRALARITDNLILMTPNFDQLDAVSPEIALAGDVSGTLSADCDLRPVQQARTVTGSGTGFRLVASATSSGTGDGTGATAIECLSSGDGIHSLIQLTRDGSRITVIGTRDAFSNQFVENQGNAAFALGLLGQTSNLVWMIPSIDDATAAGGIPSIAELTPSWVSTVMVLLFLVVIAAGFWRGRRFGPLVVENLPVIVRASETMHGRARLYEKASARLHALDALRVGTIDRLGTLCGLPTIASVDDVIRAVARATGGDATAIAMLLRDAQPANEGDLVRLSDALLDLERTTAHATRPSSATMDTTLQHPEPGE